MGNLKYFWVRRTPNAPFITSAFATGNTSAQITWSPPSHGPAPTGFEIFRNGAPIASVASNVVTYTDTTLLAGTTYTYNVAASSSHGYGLHSADNVITTTGGGGGSTHKKWNPAHGMHSNDTLFNGSAISSTEINALSGFTNIKHYVVNPTWAALEPTTLGNYDWTVLDNTITALNALSHQPHIWVIPNPGNFNYGNGGVLTAGAVSGRLPTYILNNSTYGSSPISGSYGWWGGNGNGYTAAACLHRSAVMDRWASLFEAMGARYDSNVHFEGVSFVEPSFIVGAATTNGCPDYSDSAFMAQCASWITRTKAAFPTTNIAIANTWLQYPTASQQFEANFLSSAILPSTADTYGYSLVSNTANLTPGIQAYMGITDTADGSTWTGTDYRPITRFVADIEAPDLGAYGYGYYTPADIIQALNSVYKAGYAFWAYLDSNSGAPSFNQWVNLAPVINNVSNALTNTAYPSNYP